MTKFLPLFAALFLLLGTAWAKDTPAAAQSLLKTQKEKLSYGIGINVGRNMKSQGLDIDPSTFSKGLSDAMQDKPQLMSDDEIREVIVAMQLELRMKAEKQREVDAQANKTKGEAYLTANKKKKGVVTTASGLQYKVLKDGKGKSPTPENTVSAHYKGTLIDGTEFDSSYSRGQPAEFAVSQVIPGWTEVLQLMKPGAKWVVYIPPELGYGERGAGHAIGPNATLIFEIELLEIKQ